MKTLVFLLGMLTVGACAPLKIHERTPSRPLSRDEFLLEQTRREEKLTSVEGKLHVRYSIKQGSFSGDARFIKHEGQSRFEVSDPMGRVRYWLIGDPMGILAFYDSDQIAYSAGDGGRNYFRKFFGMTLTCQELENLWTGVLPKTWREKMTETWLNDSGVYRGQIEKEKGQLIQFEVSENNREIKRVFLNQEKNSFEVTFDDFDSCCAQGGTELILGHAVAIKLPDPAEKIELEWDVLNILGQTPNPLSFNKKLGGRVKVISLDKERKRP